MKSVESVLRQLVPQPKFYGSLVGNNETAYNGIEWVDERQKPTWNEIEVAAVGYESAQAEASIISIIKQLARQTILSLATEEDQRNLLGRALELLELKIDGTATEENLAEIETIRAINQQKDAIRARSNELEVEYIAAGNELEAADIEAIQAALETAGQ